MPNGSDDIHEQSGFRRAGMPGGHGHGYGKWRRLAGTKQQPAGKGQDQEEDDRGDDDTAAVQHDLRHAVNRDNKVVTCL